MWWDVYSNIKAYTDIPNYWSSADNPIYRSSAAFWNFGERFNVVLKFKQTFYCIRTTLKVPMLYIICFVFFVKSCAPLSSQLPSHSLSDFTFNTKFYSVFLHVGFCFLSISRLLLFQNSRLLFFQNSHLLLFQNSHWGDWAVIWGTKLRFLI